MLKPDRTEYAKGAQAVFHFVPNTSAVYDELVEKYGANFVFRGNGATDGAVLTKILGLCVTGGSNIIRLYPGTFVAGAVVTVAKIGVTIEGATGNAAAVIWDCDTTDCAAFSITAAGVTLRDFSIDEPAAGTTDTISSTGVGTIIDNVIVQGGVIASTTATITCTGSYSQVKNCHLHDVRKGVSLGGASSTVSGCFIGGADGTAGNFGVTLTGAAARLDQHCVNNRIMLTGAANPIAVVVAANADAAEVSGNDLYAAGDTMTVQADTYGVGNRPLSATISATVAWLAE